MVIEVVLILLILIGLVGGLGLFVKEKEIQEINFYFKLKLGD